MSIYSKRLGQLRQSPGNNVVTTIYTCPAGKVAILTQFQLWANAGTGGVVQLFMNDGATGTRYMIGEVATSSVTGGAFYDQRTRVVMNAGDSLVTFMGSGVTVATASCSGYELTI